MSAIDRVKKLLAAADSNECFTSERASNRIRALAGDIAQALVESQEALEQIRSGEIPEAVKREGLFACLTYKETIAALALRMDALEKAMEKKR